MSLIYRFIERTLTSLLFSFLLLLVSFSYFTGKFPPQKADLYKAFHLGKRMIQEAPELNQAAGEIKGIHNQGQTPSLEQMAQFQRLMLKRTELTVELMSIFKRIQVGSTRADIAEKLNRASSNIQLVESDLNEIAKELQEINNQGAPSSVQATSAEAVPPTEKKEGL
ncbi:MAG: hypothetical protein COT73_10990 [Bdellovibrio sp. CG10_big_fil_rev_8_21_14_0_10_47_8]|nr:MAG: hypothetical protein COT73_10990 [Bdellovibrio sp. CG10_big_fil_rev_8_21_14_0_10_47_8]